MKKRIIIASLAAALVLGLTACGGATNPYEELSTGATKELSNVEQTGLAGMCEYLGGNGTIAGEFVEMKADMIGAAEGRKYGFQFEGETVIVEVYRFDLDNLDETGKATLESVKENGYFVMLEKEEVPAKLSESGEYLLINSDTKTEEVHMNETNKLERLFNEYANAHVGDKKADDGKKQDDGKKTDSSKKDASSKASSKASSQAE